MNQPTLPFMPQFSPNLATRMLYERGEDVQSMDGQCANVADMVLDEHKGHLVYVDGDALEQHGWWYHAVPYINGLVHDAWLEAWYGIPHPVPISEWLVEMFGMTDEITVCINGADIYKGLPQNFQSPQGRAYQIGY